MAVASSFGSTTDMYRWLLPLVLLSAVAQGREPPPSLALDEAGYVGSYHVDTDVESFLGIPFASPPVGKLRWQPPQPITYSPGRHDATRFSAACFQGDHMTRWYRGVAAGFGGDPETIVAPPVSEDCLYLNLWRPRAAASTALPVIVYVHGGSNRGGWSYEPNYVGEQLASEGAVVITVAYRVGPFGFFSHPELLHSNFGLLDLIASLEWIAAYVASAGGDPDNVTLVGESAGANNISQLLAMPAAKGLFRRLVHQSAGWSIRESASLTAARNRGAALQQSLGVSSLEAMRTVPAEALEEAASDIYQELGYEAVLNPVSLPVSLPQLLSRGDLPGVDLLIGSNADEWKMYLEDDQDLAGWASQNLSVDQGRAVLRELAGIPDEREALDRLITAVNYVCPSMDLARQLSAAGGNSWMYYFTRVRNGEKAAQMGAYHGAELPYLFNTHDSWLPTATADRELGQVMMEYWLNFARTGNPNRGGLPPWPNYADSGEQVMRLDAAQRPIEHPSARLCKILNNKKTGERND